MKINVEKKMLEGKSDHSNIREGKTGRGKKNLILILFL